MSNLTGIQAYARIAPCIDSTGHRFRSTFPPAGHYGYVQTVCERCGINAKEARR